MADPIAFSKYNGWVDVVDDNNVPPGARPVNAADLLRYENLGEQAAAAINEHEGRIDTLEGSSTGYGTRLTSLESGRLFIPAQNLSTVAGAPTLGQVAKHPSWLLDAALVEEVAGSFSAPPWWKTAAVDLYWSNPSATTGNVVFSLVTANHTNGDVMTAGEAAAVSTTISAPAQNALKVTRLAASISVTNPLPFLRLSRLGNNGSDTLTNDAAVIGVALVRLT